MLFATMSLTLAVVPARANVAKQAEPQARAAKAAQSKAKPKTAAENARIREQQRNAWRKSMMRTRRPKKGCFVATYPATKWREVQCKTPPNRPYPPKHGIRPAIVGGGGNGTDFSAEVTGHVSQATGSFDNVANVTSESANGSADSYSLQLNTEFFTTSTCNTSPTPGICLGWEQFVYSSSGGGFIQYWLLHYGPGGTNCPAGWISFSFPGQTEVYCYINSAGGAPAPGVAAKSLQQLKVDGAAAGVGGNADDAIGVTVNGTLYTASGDNHFPDLGSRWQKAEFNVFGDGGGDQADFNAGSIIVVRTAVDSGMPAVPPTCDGEGFTGETNNLTLVSAPAMFNDVNWPSIIFTESNAPNLTPASCGSADSIGDTHIKTFNGALYDFQASGEFVLANAPNFVVQARQASGAPRWPNASVNKAVATKIGNTLVALYIEPTRLIIDGKSTDVGDGKTILLPTGVQVSRRGNLYIISSESGDMVKAVLNSTWMDITVGLGHAPQAQARGLLGNPSEKAHALVTSTGAVLKQPVSFADLYHRFGDGWRVQSRGSLFAETTTIKPGTPSKPFYATHLNPQAYARARATCKGAGVKSQNLLDACILDTAVLENEEAARVFVHAARPRMVIKPVLRKPVAHKPVAQKPAAQKPAVRQSAVQHPSL